MTQPRNANVPENPQQAAERAAQTGDVKAASELLKSRVAASGIDPDTLQLIMQISAMMAGTMAAELRKPSPEEQEKLDKEKKRLLNQRKNAAEQGKAIADQIKLEQLRCQHQKPNGEHTFRGQVHSDGWAVIKCQRCLKKFRVQPTPDMIQNGLNLGEIKGLTEAHLVQWEKNSDQIAAYYQRQHKQPIRPFASEGAVGSI